MINDIGNVKSTLPPYLFRFIRSSWLDTPGSWFDLREGPPPERSVSMYVGNGKSSDIRTCDAVKNVGSRFELKPTGQAAEIDTAKALNSVNLRKPIINFTGGEKFHYGMIYLTTNSAEILRAKAMLTVIAKQGLTTYNHCATYTTHRSLITQKLAKKLK